MTVAAIEKTVHVVVSKPLAWVLYLAWLLGCLLAWWIGRLVEWLAKREGDQSTQQTQHS